MAKKKAESKAKPAAPAGPELVSMEKRSADVATITWVNQEGQQLVDVVSCEETKRKIKTIGSLTYPAGPQRDRMVQQLAIWKFWVACFGSAAQAQPGEEPIDRKEKPAPRARSTEELTP